MAPKVQVSSEGLFAQDAHELALPVQPGVTLQRETVLESLVAGVAAKVSGVGVDGQVGHQVALVGEPLTTGFAGKPFRLVLVHVH